MAKKKEFIPCTAMYPTDVVEAAAIAVQENPVNAPSPEIHALLDGDIKRIAVLTSAYWGSSGVKLGVAFLDNPPTTVANKILSCMNLWGGTKANVVFQQASAANAQVRISRGNGGYWSYVGTAVLSIRQGQTMNLQGFSANTPDSEYLRVVCHETGHTLGAPHEHMRQAIVARLDRNKTIAYFQQTQGWSQQEVIQQVLTPLEERSLLNPNGVLPPADQTSIMTYQLPASITTDGRPIPGGGVINDTDQAYISKIYPLAITPPPPPPPPVGDTINARISYNPTTKQWSVTPIL